MPAVIRVFDPAMCCSSGVCGPSVDPKLVRFAADLDWLAGQGAAVERFNLGQQPGAFAEDAAVKAVLETKGDAGLPLVKVNGEIKSSGVYPSRAELAGWAGVDLPAPSLFTEAVSELVAIGAAIGSGCEPCFRFHYDAARKLGVSRDDMLRAAMVAQTVRETPAKALRELIDRYLGGGGGEVTVAEAKSGSCCGSSTAERATAQKKSCC